eukprot:COSAG03_NODE_7438_length_918_cov_2.505495_1_plen_108_part_00
MHTKLKVLVRTATLEACLRQAFSASSVAATPELLVLTGDNAHGDHEAGAPYSKLQAALEDCVPPAVPVEILPGNHDRREHLAALTRHGGSNGTTRRALSPFPVISSH